MQQQVSQVTLLHLLTTIRQCLEMCFIKCFADTCRYCFPFGRPEGALKATLSLLERVLMKDIVTPVPPEDVRGMIKKCLETAALVNYTRLSSEAKIEGGFTPTRFIHHQIVSVSAVAEDLRGETMVSPNKKLDDLIHLAELCVDLLQQNEEHYAEVGRFLILN